MNALLILLLCSVAYCFASPTCTSYYDEMQKCGGFPTVAETEEELVSFCGKTSCWISAEERCGMTKKTPFFIKREQAVMCDKSNPMREKFVRNIKCLYDVSSSDEINQYRFSREDISHDEYCRKIAKFYEFLYDFVLQRCGRDGKDAFAAAYPDASFYGCP